MSPFHVILYFARLGSGFARSDFLIVFDVLLLWASVGIVVGLCSQHQHYSHLETSRALMVDSRVSPLFVGLLPLSTHACLAALGNLPRCRLSCGDHIGVSDEWVFYLRGVSPSCSSAFLRCFLLQLSLGPRGLSFSPLVGTLVKLRSLS